MFPKTDKIHWLKWSEKKYIQKERKTDRQTDQMKPNLYPSFHSCALHSRRDVDGVAPDVVVQLRRPDDAGRDVSEVEPDPEDEVELDQRLVEVRDGPLQLEDELQHLSQVLVLVSVLVPDVRVHAGRGHEGGSDGFDLFDVPEFCPIENFVEVGDEFVEDSEVFLAAHVGLVVQLVEIDLKQKGKIWFQNWKLS